MVSSENRTLALVARERLRERLALRRVKRRRGGAALRRAAILAIFYWERYRGVDWVEGRLRRRVGK
ncbi:MAG: hypothetical protein DRJ43_02430 [Thermoprotei archaeon]|nr:MAG: hypothetical protein DRJ43_02430 [Thermoprotei archaeon]